MNNASWFDHRRAMEDIVRICSAHSPAPRITLSGAKSTPRATKVPTNLTRIPLDNTPWLVEIKRRYHVRLEHSHSGFVWIVVPKPMVMGNYQQASILAILSVAMFMVWGSGIGLWITTLVFDAFAQKR